MADALLPPRGEITDRNGVPLARAFPAYALWFNPEAMDDGGAPLVRSPAGGRRRAQGDLPRPRRVRGRPPARVGQGRLPAPPRAARGRQQGLRDRRARARAAARDRPALSARHDGRARARLRRRTAHGHVGMEAALDERLRDPLRRGEPVALSIDARVQGALEDELRRGMLSVDAVGAAGIVLDVDTGEVMALASLPEFDPNKIDAAGPEARLQQGHQPGLRARLDLQAADRGRGDRRRRRSPTCRAAIRPRRSRSAGSRSATATRSAPRSTCPRR